MQCQSIYGWFLQIAFCEMKNFRVQAIVSVVEVHCCLKVSVAGNPSKHSILLYFNGKVARYAMK